MKKMNFNGFTLKYHKSINVYVNDEMKQVIFISKNNDEIHGMLELDERNKIKIHPRWNVNFSVENTEIIIDVNYSEEE
ncbi:MULTISPECIES: hypothetical protein [Gracilibacillus]|uniref:Uncharacterized protein n=1 Tax=Gracilibacillus dipsosauri TaxID=178340 RepID=A0A317L2E2_9BACI|nr:hypothetical protein [Gracilibacillus dipsosauri]PWU70012.1 hypothetical protein DLJ74_03570 [Gracilibacillus dipsosauri]